MTAASATMAVPANNRTGQVVGEHSDRVAGRNREQPRASNENHCGAMASIDRSSGRYASIVSIWRKLWPAKSSLEFSGQTGVSVRHAERVLGGQRGLSLENFQALVDQPTGLPILREFMRGCDQPWWIEIERQLEIAELRKRMAALERGESV